MGVQHGLTSDLSSHFVWICLPSADLNIAPHASPTSACLLGCLQCHLPPTPVDGDLPVIEPVFDFSRRRPPPKEEEEAGGLLSRLKQWWGRLKL